MKCPLGIVVDENDLKWVANEKDISLILQLFLEMSRSKHMS